jgi:hypothetical protein
VKLDDKEKDDDLRWAIENSPSAYLELAMRLSIGLASLDNKLVTAVKRAGIDTW